MSYHLSIVYMKKYGTLSMVLCSPLVWSWSGSPWSSCSSSASIFISTLTIDVHLEWCTSRVTTSNNLSTKTKIIDSLQHVAQTWRCGWAVSTRGAKGWMMGDLYQHSNNKDVVASNIKRCQLTSFNNDWYILFKKVQNWQYLEYFFSFTEYYCY